MALRKIVAGGQTGVDRGALDAALDASATSPREAADRLAACIAAHGVATLNVAGPQASKWPGARDYAYAVVAHLIQAHKE
jgi:hypothetical protein